MRRYHGHVRCLRVQRPSPAELRNAICRTWPIVYVPTSGLRLWSRLSVWSGFGALCTKVRSDAIDTQSWDGGNLGTISSVKRGMGWSFRFRRSAFASVVAASITVAVSGCGSQPADGVGETPAPPPDSGVSVTAQPPKDGAPIEGIDDAPTAPPESGVVVTVQPLEEKALAEGDYETVAEIRGMSVEEVEAMVGVQGRLSTFADRAIDDPAVLEFRFTPGATGGELLVEQGFDAATAFPDLDRYPEIEVVEAQLTIEQRLAAEAAISEELGTFVDPTAAVAPPIFDGFDTTYTIYLPTHDGVDIDQMQRALEQVAADATGVSGVGIEIAEPSDRVLVSDAGPDSD